MVQIGEIAPDFTLLNQDKQRINLSDYRGKKVVLFAFPKANTPGCNNQACNFRDEFPQIESANAVVLGISTDSPETLKQWQESKNLPYDLLSDPDHAVLEAWDAWGMKVAVISLPVATRSYWVIDEAGKIIDMQVGVAPKKSVEQAIIALQKAEETNHA